MRYQHTKNKNTTKQGFSLIELLVVVSIIAVIASVVVASLTDAREGARNNKRNETARQYVSALGLYQNENGTFPDAGDTSWYCLGEGYPSSQCRVYGVHSENTDIKNELVEFIQNPPSLDAFTYNDNSYFGIAYRCKTSACQGYDMSWMLEGGGADAKCFGGATSVDTGGVFKTCTFSAGQ